MGVHLSELSDGELCLKVRKRLKFSQRLMALTLKTSRSTISHVEVGKLWDKFPDDKMMTRGQRRAYLIKLDLLKDKALKDGTRRAVMKSVQPTSQSDVELKTETEAFHHYRLEQGLGEDKALKVLHKVGFEIGFVKRVGEPMALVSLVEPAARRVAKIPARRKVTYTFFMSILDAARAGQSLPKHETKEAKKRKACKEDSGKQPPVAPVEPPATVAKKRKKEPPPEQMGLPGVVAPAQANTLGNGPPVMGPPPKCVVEHLRKRREEYEAEQNAPPTKKVVVTNKNALLEVHKVLTKMFAVVCRVEENTARLLIYHGVEPATRKR